VGPTGKEKKSQKGEDGFRRIKGQSFMGKSRTSGRRPLVESGHLYIRATSLAARGGGGSWGFFKTAIAGTTLRLVHKTNGQTEKGGKSTGKNAGTQQTAQKKLLGRRKTNTWPRGRGINHAERERKKGVPPGYQRPVGIMWSHEMNTWELGRKKGTDRKKSDTCDGQAVKGGQGSKTVLKQ